MRFKHFLLQEESAYLAQKIGDILTALHELRDDAQNMGTRDLTQYSQQIVNQIRRVLHSSWPKEDRVHLATLQKTAVALMVAIDKKSDLPGTIQAVSTVIEKLVGDLGVPISKLTPTDRVQSSSEENKGVGGPEKASKTQGPVEKTSIKANKNQPPEQPQNIDTTPTITPPTGSTGQDLAAPPLGGSTGGLDAF